MRDSTIIYRSFYEAIKELPKSNQAEVWLAIFEFSLNFNEVELSGLSKTIFTLIKPQLEANIKRYKNGIKPKAEQDESKPEAKPKQDTSETQANENDNPNENNNGNENQLSITIGNQKFTGTTSEWLMLNKEGAIQVLMMKYPKLNTEDVFKEVDAETNQYHFKDHNHPYNYFKSTCDKLSGSGKGNFKPTEPTRTIKVLQ